MTSSSEFRISSAQRNWGTLNLNALAIGLGFKNTEYEPEQFPSLIYRSADVDSVVLLFASDCVVITGSPDLDTVEDVFTAVRDKMTDLLTSTNGQIKRLQ